MNSSFFNEQLFALLKLVAIFFVFPLPDLFQGSRFLPGCHQFGPLGFGSLTALNQMGSGIMNLLLPIAQCALVFQNLRDGGTLGLRFPQLPIAAAVGFLQFFQSLLRLPDPMDQLRMLILYSLLHLLLIAQHGTEGKLKFFHVTHSFSC